MSTFLNNVDTEKVTDCLNETQENVEYFQSITDKVVGSYVTPLDDIMKNIYREVIDVESPSVDTIEKYFLELSNCLYFMCDKVEKVGIYEALSKSAYKEVFNTTYLDSREKDSERKNKVTVAELTALAENSAIYESSVNEIYSRAYSIIKNKIASAQTMISTLSKVMSKRMSEMQLSYTPPVVTGRQTLNEGM